MGGIGRLIGALCLAFCLTQAAIAQGPGPDQAALTGPWHGHWLAPEGWDYEATVTLRFTGTETVSGEIGWTLRRSPSKDDQGKLGLSGVEYVRGWYTSASRTLIVDGYDKKDPNNILGLDKYRLILSDNGQVLAGITGHHDRWTAQIFLTR